MVKYQLRFWFEHGGFCVWSINDYAKEKFGYAICNNDLPISENLKNKISDLEKEYSTFLDWNCPQNGSTWSREEKLDFYNRATEVFLKLKDELGTDYEIINEVSKSID